jgi:hypothetical protein
MNSAYLRIYFSFERIDKYTNTITRIEKKEPDFNNIFKIDITESEDHSKWMKTDYTNSLTENIADIIKNKFYEWKYNGDHTFLLKKKLWDEDINKLNKFLQNKDFNFNKTHDEDFCSRIFRTTEFKNVKKIGDVTNDVRYNIYDWNRDLNKIDLRDSIEKDVRKFVSDLAEYCTMNKVKRFKDFSKD